MKQILNQKAIVFLIAMGCLPTLFAQEAKKEVHGINLEYMDRTVKPSDNFFRFVNGTWLDNTEIPADRTRWGSFDELREKTDKDMMIILNEALNNPSYTATSDQGKALNLYRTIMDTVTRNKNGIKPLKPFLDKINSNSVSSIYTEDIILQDFQPISIQCCSWLGRDLKKYTEEFGSVGSEDEPWISVYLPIWAGKPNVIFGQSVVSHFSSYHQEKFLIDNGILEEYKNKKINKT